jgi:hypothetical protein
MMDFLGKYEFITSWILLPIEIVFLCLMLWEFKYIRKEQKEKREEKTKRELNYFLWYIVTSYRKAFRVFANKYYSSKGLSDEKKYKDRLELMLKGDENIIHEIFTQEPANLLPMPFCQRIIEMEIGILHDLTPPGTFTYNDRDIFTWLTKAIDEILANGLTPNGINDSKKYFKSDKKIDEIYEKLINFKP